MAPLLRRALLLVSAAAAAFAVFAPGHVYRGPAAEPAAWNPAADRGAIVAEARKLIGVWYDPAQGRFNDLGGKLGLIVCTDVPRLAYRNAGASLLRLLEADYAAHPRHYGPKDGRPGDPYFDRRARNLYSYCKHNGCLDLTGPPQPGDIVFMSRGPDGWISHIALVSEVAADGSWQVVEASRDEWYLTRENSGEKMLGRGWAFRGFGRPLERRKKEA